MHAWGAVNKKHKRIMRFGLICAAMQLGSAFAAFRALRSNRMRQRLAAMDLRYTTLRFRGYRIESQTL